VTGTPRPAARAVKPSRISSPAHLAVERLDVAHVRSIWSSACCTGRRPRGTSPARRACAEPLEVELGGAEVVQGARPVEGLGDARGFLQVVAVPQALDQRDDLAAELGRTSGARERTISTSRSSPGGRSSGRGSAA
jgi:hypothetical protein